MIHMKPFEQAWVILKNNPYIPEEKIYPAMHMHQGQRKLGEQHAGQMDDLMSGFPAKPLPNVPIRTQTEQMNALKEALLDKQRGEIQPHNVAQRQDRHEVEHPNQSSRVKALLDLLERGGDASLAQLRMAQQQDKERDFGNPNLAPSQPTGTDVQMQPGNAMDLM